jgi:hypothetical protein
MWMWGVPFRMQPKQQQHMQACRWHQYNKANELCISVYGLFAGTYVTVLQQLLKIYTTLKPFIHQF